MDRDNIVVRCKARFQDPSGRTYSASEWASYVNDALADVYAARSDWPFAEFTSTSLSIPAGGDTVALTAGTMRVLSVFNLTDRIPMQPLIGHDSPGAYFLDNTDRGAPQFYRVFGGSLIVYPKATATTSLQVDLLQGMNTLDTGTESPVWDARFHHVLVYGALRYAYEDDGNEAMATSMQARFDRMIAQMVDAYFSPLHGGYPAVSDDF